MMNELQEKLKHFADEELVSKRYFVTENIDLQLQRFCMEHQLKPSDVLALAITELIEKYEGGSVATK